MAIVNELPTQNGMKATLLWSNPSPTDDYSGNQSLPTILDYDYIMIKYKRAKNQGSQYPLCNVINKISEIAYSTGETVLNTGCLSGENGSEKYWRAFYIMGTTLAFYNGRTLTTSSSWRTANNVGIPVEIYGVKGEIK